MQNVTAIREKNSRKIFFCIYFSYLALILDGRKLDGVAYLSFTSIIIFLYRKKGFGAGQSVKLLDGRAEERECLEAKQTK